MNGFCMWRNEIERSNEMIIENRNRNSMSSVDIMGYNLLNEELSCDILYGLKKKRIILKFFLFIIVDIRIDMRFQINDR